MLKRLAVTAAAIAVIGLWQPAFANNNKDLTLVPTHGELADKKVYDNSYALIIGINKYPNLPQQIQLHFAVADAMSMREMLIKSYGFPADHIKMLLNGQATKVNIDEALSDYADQNSFHTDDRIFVYFSGHGQTVSLPGGGQEGFLIPSDAKVDLTHIDNAAPYLRSCLQMAEIWDYLQSTPAKHVLLVADACYSGTLVQNRALDISPGALVAMASKRALQVITAGAKGETSTELDEYGHGAFTYKLLEELKSRAAGGAGNVFTTSELYASVERSVSNLTNGGQDPQFGNYKTEGNFLFITTKPQRVPDVAEVADNDDPGPTPQPYVAPTPQVDPDPIPTPAPRPTVKPTVKPKSHPSTPPATHHAAYNEAAMQRLRDLIQNAGPPPYEGDKEAQLTSDIKSALEDGANPNGDVDSEPALIAAISYECMPAVKLLLKYGAKPNISRTGGDTPMSLAREMHMDEVIALLRQYGAQ